LESEECEAAVGVEDELEKAGVLVLIFESESVESRRR
jgi:hypothetical protein